VKIEFRDILFRSIEMFFFVFNMLTYLSDSRKILTYFFKEVIE